MFATHILQQLQRPPNFANYFQNKLFPTVSTPLLTESSNLKFCQDQVTLWLRTAPASGHFKHFHLPERGLGWLDIEQNGT